MELIASSRIVKAQQRVEESRPYAVQLTEAMEDLARNAGSLSHPLLEEREEPRKAGVLVCTSDRGLAGAYNANVIKEAEGVLADVRRRGLEPVRLRERQEGRQVLPVPRRADPRRIGRASARCPRTRWPRRSAGG